MGLSYMEETTLRALAARAEVADLNARHHRAFETGDLEAWLGTFQVEGVLVPAGGEAVEGHPALARWFKETSRDLVRVTTDMQVSTEGVKGRQECRFLVLRASGAGLVVESVGRYVDELVHERGAWYLARREVVTDLSAGS